MSATAEKKEKTTIGTYQAFEIAVRNTRKNGYIRDDTRGSSNPISINAPARMFVPLESRHFDERTNNFVPIQYIPGAPTIFLNDYVDENGVSQKGLLSLGFKKEERSIWAERAGAYEAVKITFKNGVLDLRQIGGDGDPNLVAFVNMHEQNLESPAGKRKDRRVNHMFVFRPIRAEEKAVKATSNFEDQLEGMNIVGRLRTKQSDSSYVYDEPMMNAILNMLGKLPIHYGPEAKAQKFEDILRFAQANPASFAALVKEATEQVRMIIGKASAFKILQISSKNVNMKLGDSAPVEIYEFKEKSLNENDRVTTLAIALMGDAKLSNHYINICTEVESKGG